VSRLVTLLIASMLLAPTTGSECIGLANPVDGPVTVAFAPVGRYAGHWGIDLAAEPGSTVTAPAHGTVSFVGTVVGNTAVTIDHGGGVVSTVSYLDAPSVTKGQLVAVGQAVGTSGTAHGAPALHFSVRIDRAYVDPGPLLGCRWVVPGDALRLVP
jgi:murein DD-endopeptidase MepM/ murein hydrolase activator NlpD